VRFDNPRSPTTRPACAIEWNPASSLAMRHFLYVFTPHLQSELSRCYPHHIPIRKLLANPQTQVLLIHFFLHELFAVYAVLLSVFSSVFLLEHVVCSLAETQSGYLGPFRGMCLPPPLSLREFSSEAASMRCALGLFFFWIIYAASSENCPLSIPAPLESPSGDVLTFSPFFFFFFFFLCVWNRSSSGAVPSPWDYEFLAYSFLAFFRFSPVHPLHR